MKPSRWGARRGSPIPPRLRFAFPSAALVLAGCGGGAPLLHPAHVLPPGEVMVGGGVSGQLALRPIKATPAPSPGAASSSQDQLTLQDVALAPGVAPWGAGRVGLPGSNEGGLTYAGRTFRIDARHAFALGPRTALSVGLGASVMADSGLGHQSSGVYGGGADIPVLIGFRSTGDLYAFWFGPRGGFDVISAHDVTMESTSTPVLYDITGKHFYAGLTAGARVGFRHVHLAVELNAAYHAADGTLRTSPTLAMPAQGAPASTNVQQLSLTPAGALEVTF